MVIKNDHMSELKKNLIRLLERHTKKPNRESIVFHVLEMLQMNARGEIFMPDYVIDCLLMVAYDENVSESIMDMAIYYLERNSFK